MGGLIIVIKILLGLLAVVLALLIAPTLIGIGQILKDLLFAWVVEALENYIAKKERGA